MQLRRAGACLTAQQARPVPFTLHTRLLRLASRQMPAAHCWRRRCCLRHLNCRTVRLPLRSRPRIIRCRPRCLHSHQVRACPHCLHCRLVRPGQHRLTSHPLHRPHLSPRRPCHQRRHCLLGHIHHRHRMCRSPRRPRRQRRRHLRFRRLGRRRKCCFTHRAPRPYHLYRYHQAHFFRRSCRQRLRGRHQFRPSGQEVVEPT